MVPLAPRSLMARCSCRNDVVVESRTPRSRRPLSVGSKGAMNFTRFTRSAVAVSWLLGSVAWEHATAQVPTSAAAEIKVTLLGTGGPAPSVDRFSACVLVEAGTRKLLFDAARGCAIRVQQARVAWSDLSAVFVTHLHSDHVLGIPDIFLTGWTAGRTMPFEVWGPKGTNEMMTHVAQAYRFDIATRLANSRQPPQLVAIDIVPGVVYERDGVKVTAFDVDHGDVKPAFGYRIDFGRRSVVLSGDTRFSENLIRIARETDVLVHEVALGAPSLSAQQAYAMALHTLPDQAAEVFRRVHPRLAVYSHVLLLGDVSSNDVIARTRATYVGPLEMGTDLTVIDVGREIAVSHIEPEQRHPGGRSDCR
jgi:ribonuclease Z